MRSYCVVVGQSWHPGHVWRRRSPGRPFVGLRFDPDSREVWVLCEVAVNGDPLPVAVQEKVERTMEHAAWEVVCLGGVAIARVRTIRQGRRLARAVVAMLGPYERPEQMRPAVAPEDCGRPTGSEPPPQLLLMPDHVPGWPNGG